MFNIAFGLFISGLLFGSGPCIASCGPILISYIAGTKKNILKGLGTYVLFSSARISAYLLLGVAIFFLGRFTLERLLGNSAKYIFILGGGFIVLVGVLTSLGNRLEIKPLRFFYQSVVERDKKSIFMLGLIIGLLPCAPLLAILSYVGLISRSWLQSLMYSFFFGIGTFASPLIILTVLAGLIPQALADKKAYYNRIFSFICGLVIIFWGIKLVVKAF